MKYCKRCGVKLKSWEYYECSFCQLIDMNKDKEVKKYLNINNNK